MSSVPAPPGTQITSSCGQSAKVVVGVSVSTESLGTGSIRFQIRCTCAPGTLENTCTGPVRRSCVTLGEIKRPTCSGVGMGVDFECFAVAAASSSVIAGSGPGMTTEGHDEADPLL